jgi:hypothetical protein
VSGDTGSTGVNESGTMFVDLFEVDNELGRVTLGEREHLGAEQGEDVIGDQGGGLGSEVGIVDTEMVVEPVDFVLDEFAWDKALRKDKY